MLETWLAINFPIVLQLLQALLGLKRDQSRNATVIISCGTPLRAFSPPPVALLLEAVLEFLFSLLLEALPPVFAAVSPFG
jgi:hypothetical protein